MRTVVTAVLIAAVSLCSGCDAIFPKVDSPRAIVRQKEAGAVGPVPRVDPERAQAELEALAREAKEDARAAADELARELKARQREAERAAKKAEAAHADSIDDIADRYAEVVEAAKLRFASADAARRRGLDQIAETTQAAIADAQARASVLGDVVQFAGGAAQASGVPGIATAGSLLLGLGGLVFGGGHVVLPLLRAEIVPRAWLTDVCGAAQLGLALDGNQVAVLQSISHGDGTSTVALLLCDASGRPVIRWAVQSDGTYSASIDGEPTPGS